MGTALPVYQIPDQKYNIHPIQTNSARTMGVQTRRRTMVRLRRYSAVCMGFLSPVTYSLSAALSPVNLAANLHSVKHVLNVRALLRACGHSRASQQEHHEKYSKPCDHDSYNENVHSPIIQQKKPRRQLERGICLLTSGRKVYPTF